MSGDDENETNEDNETIKNASSLPSSADYPLFREDDVNDDGENTEDESEEEKRVELERRNASSITINATITTGDDDEEEATKTFKSTSKREEEKDIVVQKNEKEKEEEEDDEMMMMMMQRQNSEGGGRNANEDEEEEDPDFYKNQVEKTKVAVVSTVGNILKEYEKQSADVRKALEFTRKRGFGGVSSGHQPGRSAASSDGTSDASGQLVGRSKASFTRLRLQACHN